MADRIPGLVRALHEGDDDAKARVARVLGNLASSNPGNRVAIAAAGAVAPLVALKNKVAIAAAGGIPPLVALVAAGSELAKSHAAGALASLAFNNPSNKVAIAAADGISPLVALVETGIESAKWPAACALANLAFKNDGNKSAIAAAGGIPPLKAPPPRLTPRR
ncbi:hypothetical protein JL720_6160 [Aureococcus anophagefferens]|nr:hypothetical protein JL720_6160 [Aureococcus anophagefferens]